MTVSTEPYHSFEVVKDAKAVDVKKRWKIYLKNVRLIKNLEFVEM